MGDNVSAVKLENATAAAMANANSVNSLPMLPSRKTNGTNTEISTSVVAITANPTSLAPR